MGKRVDKNKEFSKPMDKTGKIVKLSEVISVCGECLGRMENEELDRVLSLTIQSCCTEIRKLSRKEKNE